ncbi:hypothetical protein KBD45_03120 [Candidatus Dojkabacteria bacterium]|nr:hypothetical protein [Candidatus Dojkabacteria bacterium]
MVTEVLTQIAGLFRLKERNQIKVNPHAREAIQIIAGRVIQTGVPVEICNLTPIVLENGYTAACFSLEKGNNSLTTRLGFLNDYCPGCEHNPARLGISCPMRDVVDFRKERYRDYIGTGEIDLDAIEFLKLHRGIDISHIQELMGSLGLSELTRDDCKSMYLTATHIISDGRELKQIVNPIQNFKESGYTGYQMGTTPGVIMPKLILHFCTPFTAVTAPKQRGVLILR